MPSLLPKFSHLYVEKEVQKLPRTQALLKRFHSAEVVLIDSYKEILNRNKQEWAHQKLSPKLILARKPDSFLYAGSPVTPNFNFEHFYYNSLVLNCIYDCQYCYLQGMFPSAHMVAFVNLEDFFDATRQALKKMNPLYLCISYDTDLLAIEDVLSYCKEWIEFARDNPSLIIELRTKSVNIKVLEECQPCSNVILAWTISPQFVTDRYEQKTPSLEARIKAIKRCAALGWKIRVCFDPVLRVSEWQKHYSETVQGLAIELNQSAISEFSIGSFRMNTQYFSRLRGNHSSDLFYYPYKTGDGMVGYSDQERDEISTLMRTALQSSFPGTPVNVCL